MKIRHLATATLIGASVLLTACGQDLSKTDLGEPTVVGDVQPESYTAQSPDKVTVYQNVDNHPTIVKLCIDGIAFRTISSSHSGLASPAVDRVPEWDASC